MKELLNHSLNRSVRNTDLFSNETSYCIYSTDLFKILIQKQNTTFVCWLRRETVQTILFPTTLSDIVDTSPVLPLDH